MGKSLLIFALATGMVTLAEMGDKTQLLAMAFATRYKAYKVMLGVFIATVLNHALAVWVGCLVGQNEALNNWIQPIAAVSFIFFGLWTIRGDKLDGEDKKKTKYGAIVTVAIAFFIAELGDKTQLATISLASSYPGSPIYVLMGTTLGMLIADGIGIVIGVVLAKRIPERTVKLISAGAFILFGLSSIGQLMYKKLEMSAGLTALNLIVIALITYLIAAKLYKKSNKG